MKPGSVRMLNGSNLRRNAQNWLLSYQMLDCCKKLSRALRALKNKSSGDLVQNQIEDQRDSWLSGRLIMSRPHSDNSCYPQQVEELQDFRWLWKIVRPSQPMGISWADSNLCVPNSRPSASTAESNNRALFPTHTTQAVPPDDGDDDDDWRTKKVNRLFFSVSDCVWVCARRHHRPPIIVIVCQNHSRRHSMVPLAPIRLHAASRRSMRWGASTAHLLVCVCFDSAHSPAASLLRWST